MPTLPLPWCWRSIHLFPYVTYIQLPLFQESRHILHTILHRHSNFFYRIAQLLYGFALCGFHLIFGLVDNQDYRVLYVNDAYEKIWGQPCKKLYENPSSWLDAVHPDDHTRVEAALYHQQSTGAFEEEFRIVRPDGTIRWIYDRMFAIKNEVGEAYRSVGIAEDITGRRQSEQELAQQFRAMDTSIDGICIVDPAGRFTHVNDALVRMYGYACREELIGKKWDVLYGEEELARFDRDILPVFSREGHWMGETIGTKQDGSIFPQEISMTALEGGGLVCSDRDITERKETEERIQETSRLASIGELAAGVAHEINNPLTSVLGFSQLLLAEDLPPEIQADIQKIHSGAQRATKVVQNLLSFSRKQDFRPQYMDLAPILERALDIKSYDLTTGNIRVTQELSHDLPRTMLDEHQLIQAIVNLLTNAEQALRLVRGEGLIVIRATSSQSKIRLSIIDNGPGIPPERLTKVFEPFFTTKEVGEGTGLGLSICYGIVRQHNGNLWAESNEGEGASFHIELPIVGPEDDLDVGPLDQRALQTSGATKHLLVVDDEPHIRDPLARVLELERYTVDLAVEGEEAWRKLREQSYDCVVLDLKMPGMSGQEFYRRIEGYSNELARKVIFITGDTISPDTTDFVFSTGNPVVSKPLDMDVLRSQVLHCLEETKDA